MESGRGPATVIGEPHPARRCRQPLFRFAGKGKAKYEEVLGYPALRLNFRAGLKFSFPVR